jgi:hypothetical protein
MHLYSGVVRGKAGSSAADQHSFAPPPIMSDGRSGYISLANEELSVSNSVRFHY